MVKGVDLQGGDLGGNDAMVISGMVHVPGWRKVVISGVVFVPGWASESDQWRGV